MASYRFEQRSCVVATAPSAARAEFIQITLAAHGITATMTPRSIYPSVDFVEGIGVIVAEAEEQRANNILNQLGLDTGRVGG
ncbi:MAG: hypothetical protein ACLGIB_08850 [Actinomycetota bacterium]